MKVLPKKAIRNTSGLATLEPFFSKLLSVYHDPQWLKSDPIQFAHRYPKPEDREVVAFLSACFAYGSVILVHRAIEGVLTPMGEHPAQFIRNYRKERVWSGFYHRFHKEGHLEILILLLKKILTEYGSLSSFFESFANNNGSHHSARCESSLNGAARWLQNEGSLLAVNLKRPELERGVRFFFNAPEDGSACKRMLMYMRWMVRDDAIDLGIWKWLSPRELVIPADTHVARISYYLRLRKGRENQAASWKMALEITESLRQINPKDPVIYDFAIARLGILDICKRKYTTSICERCPVAPGCRFSQL
jgi:uncharacterized protein (TIGR02757 family)